MIPKAKEGDIRTVCDLLLNVEREINIQAGSIKLFPIIETAYGLENAHSIISSSHRIIGVLFGAEDFLADMGVTGAATESILSYARIGVAVACRASDIDSIDTPYLDIGDDKGLFTETRKAKSAGMTGKAAIHPNQIEIIHQIYAPSQDEVEHAKKIIEMSKIMAAEGKGAFLVNGKMVDAPIIKKALNIVQKAELTGTR
jgi:citrate lyase subunit beta/citryl-CoA lyase